MKYVIDDSTKNIEKYAAMPRDELKKLIAITEAKELKKTDKHKIQNSKFNARGKARPLA